MRIEVAFIAAALLSFTACDRGSGASPPSTASGPSGGASANVPPALEPTADLTPLAEAVKMNAGSRVRTRAFLWLERPNCPPCPAGAKCEPCPPSLLQFSEKPNTGAGAEPGAILLSDFNGSEPKLDLKTEYLLEGLLENNPQAKPHPFLRIEKIGVLKPAR